MKRKIALCLALVLCVGLSACKANKTEPRFEYWTEDAPAMLALQAYVKAVTDEKSESFIPQKDRIAVFDMDGTLYGEKAPIYLEWCMFKYRVLGDPDYEAPEEVRAVADKIVQAIQTGVIPEELEMEHAYANAMAFSGMTLEEFRHYANTFILRDAEGFEGLTYAAAWYWPMLEVVDYLNENGFIVYVCSGTDRFLCRTLAEGMLDVPDEHFIGMDVLLEASGQHGTDGLDYVYTTADEVVRTDKLIIKNVKANKVSQIVQEIGRQPVLVFGNSTGDTSMAMYATSANPYPSAAFMVVADDTEREYGNAEKAAQLRAQWEAYGWNVISMRDDFLTIYGDDVTLG